MNTLVYPLTLLLAAQLLVACGPPSPAARVAQIEAALATNPNLETLLGDASSMLGEVDAVGAQVRALELPVRLLQSVRDMAPAVWSAAGAATGAGPALDALVSGGATVLEAAQEVGAFRAAFERARTEYLGALSDARRAPSAPNLARLATASDELARVLDALGNYLARMHDGLSDGARMAREASQALEAANVLGTGEILRSLHDLQATMHEPVPQLRALAIEVYGDRDTLREVAARARGER